MLSALHVWIYFIFTSILQNGHNWRCWDPHFTHEETDAHRSCIIWSSSESKWHLQTRKLSLERYLTCLKTNGKPISKLSAMPANWHGLTMWLALVKGIFVDVIQAKSRRVLDNWVWPFGVIVIAMRICWSSLMEDEREKGQMGSGQLPQRRAAEIRG